MSYAVVKDKHDPDRRLLLPMGNNLAAEGSGLAYRIAGIRLERGITATIIVGDTKQYFYPELALPAMTR